MKIDSKKLEKNLQRWEQTSRENTQNQILFQLLHLIESKTPVSQIDFDSFNLDDLERLRDATRRLDLAGGKRDTSRNFLNPVHELLARNSVFVTLQNPSFKIYVPTDDFI